MMGASHLTWVRTWKVPLGTWNTRFFFFAATGNILGKFVCVDGITSRKKRLDYARFLMNTTNSLIDQ